MTYFIGIDPGKTGGIVSLHDGSHIDSIEMPVVDKEIDILATLQWLKVIRGWANRDGETFYVGMERASAMPGQGVCSMFSFGTTYGILQGLIVALSPTAWSLFRPKEWQKSMWGSGIASAIDPKGKSIIAAKRLFPEANLHLGPRSGKPHLGIVDALLIAGHTRKIFG
jgi:hypothetical protein